MLRFTVAVLVVALAGTANAAGWRGMRIDSSSDASFAKSVTALRLKLSPARRYVFDLALQDIQGKYTASEYRQQIDGLRYKEVVMLTDPTGATADARYEAASVRFRRPTYSGPAFTRPTAFQQGPPPGENGRRGDPDSSGGGGAGMGRP